MDLNPFNKKDEPGKIPPGQRFARRWAIYAALGAPEVKLSDWSLTIDGLVEEPKTYSWEDLHQMPQINFTRSFNCVTGWSIMDVKWEGVSLKSLLLASKPKPESQWLMFSCVDGYTAPVPLEDALVDDGVLAFSMNGRPLSREQGFPARPFIPQLYGWKSAKYVNKMTLLPEYRDGYWEVYGYHQRANIWEEERFKRQGMKHTPRRGLGTAEI